MRTTYFRGAIEFYGDTHREVWPHRLRRLRSPDDDGKIADDESVVLTSRTEKLLSQLDALEKNTRPAKGAASAVDKDQAAFTALSAAFHLVNEVAGWAIAHQCGTAAEGLEYLPIYDTSTREAPEYQRRKSMLDSHEHERLGAEVHRKAANAELARRCIGNILSADGYILPRYVSPMLLDALKSLAYGEQAPLFAPAFDGNKRNYSELNMQLEALCMIAFRNGGGMSKEEARSDVADRFGLSPDTLKSWERRLKIEFGKIHVNGQMRSAKAFGGAARALKLRRDNGDETASTEFHESTYGDAALMALVRAYNVSLRGD